MQDAGETNGNESTRPVVVDMSTTAVQDVSVSTGNITNRNVKLREFKEMKTVNTITQRCFQVARATTMSMT